MKKINIKNTHPKFLIFRNGAIGNTLVATSFIRNLKENFPDAFIAVVVDEVGLALLKKNPHIDKYFIFNRNSDTFKYQLKLIKELRAVDFDVSFHLRTGVRNELLAFLSRIPCRVGANLKGSFQFLTHIVYTNKTNGHIINKVLSLLDVISGMPIKFYSPELFVDPENKNKCDTYLHTYRVKPKKYIIVHPTGKTMGQINWNLSFYQNLVNNIRKKYDIPVIVIGTPGEEPQIREYFSEDNKLILMLELDIGLKAELIHQSLVFIGNDSGPSHIAEAWKIPSAVVFKNDPLNFEKWGPLEKNKTLVIFQDEFDSDDINLKIDNFINEILTDTV